MNCFPHLDNTNQIFFFFLPVWPGRLAMAVVPTLELHSDFTDFTIEVIAKHLFHQRGSFTAALCSPFQVLTGKKTTDNCNIHADLFSSN